MEVFYNLPDCRFLIKTGYEHGYAVVVVPTDLACGGSGILYRHAGPLAPNGRLN
jgi:hypothetical protein